MKIRFTQYKSIQGDFTDKLTPIAIIDFDNTSDLFGQTNTVDNTSDLQNLVAQNGLFQRGKIVGMAVKIAQIGALTAGLNAKGGQLFTASNQSITHTDRTPNKNHICTAYTQEDILNLTSYSATSNYNWMVQNTKTARYTTHYKKYYRLSMPPIDVDTAARGGTPAANTSLINLFRFAGRAAFGGTSFAPGHSPAGGSVLLAESNIFLQFWKSKLAAWPVYNNLLLSNAYPTGELWAIRAQVASVPRKIYLTPVPTPTLYVNNDSGSPIPQRTRKFQITTTVYVKLFKKNIASGILTPATTNLNPSLIQNPHITYTNLDGKWLPTSLQLGDLHIRADLNVPPLDGGSGEFKSNVQNALLDLLTNQTLHPYKATQDALKLLTTELIHCTKTNALETTLNGLNSLRSNLSSIGANTVWRLCSQYLTPLHIKTTPQDDFQPGSKECETAIAILVQDQDMPQETTKEPTPNITQ